MASVWRGQINFGLVSIPVQLHTAARGKSVELNLLHKGDHARIKQVMFCSAEDKAVERGDLVKGFQYQKGAYVIVEEEDFQKVIPKSSRVMDILEFVPEDEIDPIYLEKSYWMAPSKGGEKAYALLFAALRSSGLCGIAKLTMYKREHILFLRCGERGIAAHTMFYQDEIKAADQFHANLDLVSDKELAMAQMLVGSLVAAFEPAKYRDEYRHNIQEMIQAKVDGKEIIAAPLPAPKAPVIDIMDALKRSLEKKAPAAAEAVAGKRKKKA